MQIPFGSRKPNEQEKSLLEKLGFDITKIENKGRYYYLDVPSNSKLRCKVEQPAFDRLFTTVFYQSKNSYSPPKPKEEKIIPQVPNLKVFVSDIYDNEIHIEGDKVRVDALKEKLAGHDAWIHDYQSYGCSYGDDVNQSNIPHFH